LQIHVHTLTWRNACLQTDVTYHTPAWHKARIEMLQVRTSSSAFVTVWWAEAQHMKSLKCLQFEAFQQACPYLLFALQEHQRHLFCIVPYLTKLCKVIRIGFKTFAPYVIVRPWRFCQKWTRKLSGLLCTLELRFLEWSKVISLVPLLLVPVFLLSFSICLPPWSSRLLFLLSLSLNFLCLFLLVWAGVRTLAFEHVVNGPYKQFNAISRRKRNRSCKNRFCTCVSPWGITFPLMVNFFFKLLELANQRS